MSFDSFGVCFLYDSLSFPLSKHKKFKLHVQLRGQRLHCCLVIVLASGVFPLLCFVSLTVPSEVPVCVRNLPIASNTRDFPDNIHVKTTNRLESLHNLMFTL